jgi:hypothetical protein
MAQVKIDSVISSATKAHNHHKANGVRYVIGTDAKGRQIEMWQLDNNDGLLVAICDGASQSFNPKGMTNAQGFEAAVESATKHFTNVSVWSR